MEVTKVKSKTIIGNSHILKPGYHMNYGKKRIEKAIYNKFPFESLAVNDIQKNTQSIKYLSNVKEIRVDYDYETYQVFNMSGHLISSGNSSKTIFTNGWNKGVYVIKTIDKQGKANTAKILVF